MENFISFLEIGSTLLIVLMTGWITTRFWRGYQEKHDTRNLSLTLVFGFIFAYKADQLIFDQSFGISGFHWMDNELASEGLIVLLAVIVIIVLTRGFRYRKRETARY